MDEFVEKSRSNYFRVKSGSEFEKLCEKWGLEILYGESGIRAGKFGFIISDGYRQKGRSIHKFKKTLSELLEEEEICIVRTVAYERDSMNELHARTIAIDSQGRELTVDLDDLNGQGGVGTGSRYPRGAKDQASSMTREMFWTS